MCICSLGWEWQPTPVFLPGESHGQRSLAGTVHRVAQSRIRVKRLSKAHPPINWTVKKAEHLGIDALKLWCWRSLLRVPLYCKHIQFSSLASHPQLFETPCTAAHQAPRSFSISQSLLKFVSIELLMPSNHLILCNALLNFPQSFPALRVSTFSNESALRVK